MSYVTNIIVLPGDQYPRGEWVADFAERYYEITFTAVDATSCGGNKNLETEIYTAAVSLFLEDEFRDALTACRWQYPENVRYAFKRQDDEAWTFRALGAS
jgi:hypothetical protein